MCRRNPYPGHYSPAFASSDLLLPHCHESTLRSTVPVESLFPGAIRGFHVSSSEPVGLGACCRPGGVWATNAQHLDAFPASIPFWASVGPMGDVPSPRARSTTFACRISRSLRRFRCLHHTDDLALPQLCGYQEGPPLAIGTPHISDVLRYIVRTALDSSP